MKYLALIVIALLAGCQDRFRYPCQDSRNWEQPQCKRPTCAITGTCPDQLTRPEDRKTEEERPQ